MALHRTILALLLSLTMAFAPIASLAMARSCAMTTEMTATNSGDCPCHNSMPDCGTMPQCQTASVCASQCFASCGILPSAARQSLSDRDELSMRVSTNRSSLEIQPPSPPPRI